MPLAETPLTNKQHAVPQNIMDVEFKLIGDLTMRQFTYLLICGGLAYFSAVTVIGIFKWPLLIFFSLLGLGLAFVPIQERGLDEWVVAFIRAVYSPTQRIWKKSPSIPSAFMYESINVVKQELITLAPTSSRRKLEEYLKYQDKSVKSDPLDIPEQEYILKVREAFASYAPTTTVAVEPEVTVDALPQPITTEVSPHQEPFKEPLERESAKEETPSPQPSVEKPEAKVIQTPGQKPVIEQQSPQPKPPAKKKDIRDRVKIPQLPKLKQKYSVPISPLTPDMHAGRRFTNLLPYGNELILPIRGEKVLSTSDAVSNNIADDLSEKANKLQQLLGQIKQSEDLKRVSTPSVQPQEKSNVAAPVEVAKQSEEISEKIKEESIKISEEIQHLQEEISSPNLSNDERMSKEALLKKLQLQKEQTQADFTQLNQQILELQTKLKSKEDAEKSEGPKPAAPTFATIQPITNQANVISGIVKDNTGKFLESILLIVKNDKGEPVRAFKTNSLGQFRLITPLTNGLYSIEVSSSNNTDLTFDIISVDIKGEVIPPIEIVGRNKVS